MFSTEYAPEEEIEGVKAVLDKAGIPYYEIRNSTLWLGGGSLCVKDAGDFERARAAIEAFQEQWRERAADAPARRGINWVVAVPLLILILLFVVVTIQSLSG